MSDLNTYINERGITSAQMEDARRKTHQKIESYNLRQARKAINMTQVELAEILGVSQNRISRMENGNLGSMSLDTIRKYIEAVGGELTLTADLPIGHVVLI